MDHGYKNFAFPNHVNKQVRYSVLSLETVFEESKMANGKSRLHIANCIPKSLLIDNSTPFGGLVSQNHVDQSGEITNIG